MCISWIDTLTKVVIQGSQRYFSGFKVETVKLIGSRRYLAALRAFAVLSIQTVAFTQIIAILTPGRSLEDHLNSTIGTLVFTNAT